MPNPNPQSKYPTRAISLTEHPATLPQASIPEDVDHEQIVTAALGKLPWLKTANLTDTAIWRDSLALTGTLRTFFRSQLIIRVWQELSELHSPKAFELIPGSSDVIRVGPETCWVQARFSFEITGQRPARCSGIIGLVPDGRHWKIWLLSTILEQPQGFPDVDDLQPVLTRAASTPAATVPEYVECLVIGGSIAGLSMAGRLQALDISYVVVEKDAHVGDAWTKHRYESLKLHTSKGYNQLPGEPRSFRPEDRYHLNTTDLADGFERYVRMFGINVLSSTTMVSGSYDDQTKTWSVKLQRSSQTLQMQAHHIVLAVGSMGVKPTMPSYSNRDKFKGDVIHGMHWRSAKPWGPGSKGIVIGSANTAQGVIGDMADSRFDSITMIQRSKTFLLPTFTFGALVDPVYNENTPVPVSDRMLLGPPLPIQRLMAKAGIAMCSAGNPDYFDRIEAQGFDIERNGDLWGMMYDREGGHFFDLGAGELIANGTVKVRSDAPVAYTETGLKMSDGSMIDADVVVVATGYTGNIKNAATSMFGEEVGNRLEEFWQCDEEGESRGAWKNTGHPRLWYTGHGFAHARYYARFVAIHIKADLEGRPIQMYEETPNV